MKFQTLLIPRLRDKVGETHLQNEKTVSPTLLDKHMTPDDKVALIVVDKGSLEFVWEDDPDTIYTVDPSHPLVVEPKRYHHISVKGRVDFRLEFYKDVSPETPAKKDHKTGEDFIEVIISDEPIDRRIKGRQVKKAAPLNIQVKKEEPKVEEPKVEEPKKDEVVTEEIKKD